MLRTLILGTVLFSCEGRSIRDEEQFVFPEQMLSQFGVMPSFNFAESMFSPSWGAPSQFDMFPMQPDALWNSLISSFDHLMASSIISMPEIHIDDNCVVSVKLSPDTKLNDTDIKVYTSENDIELHITTVKIREWHDNNNEEDIGNGTTDVISSSTGEAVSPTNVPASPPRLRGFGEMSSSTTIRKIPAPDQCDVFNEEAKATLDTHTNSLLIKFPVKKSAVADNSMSSSPIDKADSKNQVQQAGEIVDLAPIMDKSPQKRSWWSSMFEQKKERKTVPIVNREEF